MLCKNYTRNFIREEAPSHIFFHFYRASIVHISWTSLLDRNVFRQILITEWMISDSFGVKLSAYVTITRVHDLETQRWCCKRSRCSYRKGAIEEIGIQVNLVKQRHSFSKNTINKIKSNYMLVDEWHHTEGADEWASYGQQSSSEKATSSGG